MITTASYAKITDWFRSNILTRQLEDDEICVGVSWGTSLDGWYRYVLEHTEIWEGIDTEKLRFGLVDERCVPEGDKERNDVHVLSAFLSHLICENIIEKDQCIFPNSWADYLDYNERMRPFDFAIFWIGVDGHIASLFPRHEVLQSDIIWFIQIVDAPKEPKNRISLSPKSIRKIPHMCYFFVWNTKKDAYKNFLDNSISVEDCPAKIGCPEIIFCD